VPDNQQYTTSEDATAAAAAGAAGSIGVPGYTGAQHQAAPQLYDVVVASEVIEHVRRPDRFCVSLASVLRPGKDDTVYWFHSKIHLHSCSPGRPWSS
jgi:2-polyprenyl-3-methyl-5-hydroxy-6-metoxy-1,4-benzoquinol methylase